MANRIQRIILPHTEYSRFRAASELARKTQVPTAQILQALGEIVDLLDEQALLEVEIRYLDSPPVLLLALPPGDCDQAIAPDEIMVLAVTRGGTLVKAVLRYTPEGWEWRKAEPLQIPSFDPRRDRALGLYWTRSTMRFRKTPDLILVTRQGGTDHVYLNRLTGPQQSELLHIGNQMPDWMEVCPVGAPVGIDLLAEPPVKRPPAEATAAVSISSKFFAAIPHKPAEGPVVVNADFIHCLGSHLIFSRSPQTLHCRPLDKTEDKKEGNRRLRDKPVCFCPCPMIEDEFRLVVGHETGHLSLMVIVRPETLKDVWSTLQQALEANEGINSFESWISWTGRELQEPRFDKSRGKVAAILRALLERLPSEGNVDTTLNDNVARLFRQPLSFNEFLPVMRPLRDLIEKWRGPRSCHGAAIVERIYSHLPYTLQDLFDLELARHDQELTASLQIPEPPFSTPPSEPDVKAYAELRKDWKTTRARLLAKEETTALARTALWTEQWLERFVLEVAHPSRQRDQPARVRAWNDFGHALVVHPKALFLLAPDRDLTSLEEIKVEDFDASRIAFVQQDEDQISRLVVGNEKQIRLLDIQTEEPVCARALEQLDLPDGQELSLASDAGGGRVLLVLSSRRDTEVEVWLYSWTEGILGKGRIEHLPREMVVLPSGVPDQWWLVSSVADEEIGLLRLSRQGETLDAEVLSRRHLRGKVRSIAAARDLAGPFSLVVFVGTASGYIFSLTVPDGSFSFELAWIYRLHGAIRHLHFRPLADRHLLLALGAAGEAVLLDRSGQHHWMADLAVPLNSGVFLQQGEILLLCLVDVEGNVRLYREMDSRKAWSNAQGSLKQVTPEQWKEGRTARWELATAMQLLVLDPPLSWQRFSSLQTRAARISVLRRLSEMVAEEGQISTLLRSILPDILEESRLQELRVLARLSSRISLVARKDLVLYLLREVARRADKYEETDTEHRLEAEDLLAEMVNGLGAGLLRPSRLLESDLEAWWRIPEEVRRDLWVVSALLVSGAHTEPEACWALSALVEQATFLGPRAFELLPLIVSPADVEAAEALREAIDHILQDTKCSKSCPDRLRELLDGGRLRAEAVAFVRLLELLVRPETSWAAFLETTVPVHGGDARLHPALHHFVQWSHPYHSLSSPDMEQATVEDQLQDLEQMASDHSFDGPSRPGDWDDWLRAARDHFGRVVTGQLDHQRKELRRRQWVRLEDFKVERQGPRLASVRARLVRDGVQRHSARVVVHAASSGSGVRALDGDLSASWAWDQVPDRLEWLCFLEEGARQVNLVSETILEAENYRHRFSWTASIPPAERSVTDTLLDRIPALRSRMVESVQKIKKDVHLLALDEELGAHALAAALLETGGSHLVKLDDDFRAVGPGRADPAGFTAERLLQALEARENAKGEWKVRRTAGRTRIVVFPSEETVARLLTPTLRPMLEEVGKILRRLDGLPVFWILPTEQASALKAALGTAVRFHALHVLPERSTLGKAGARELETWVASTAGVGSDEAGEALDVFGGNVRLFLAWTRPGADRQKPQEFLRSAPAADTCLRQELAGVGLHELGDMVAARCSRTRLSLRELREGMKPLETIRSTVKKGSPTDLIRAGEELTAQTINNLRSDPGAGRWPEVRVEGLHSEGRSSDADQKIRPLYLALRRSAAAIQQTHRQLAERQVLSVQGKVAHVRNPFRIWLDRQLELDPSGRTWVESLHGKKLFESLTFEEMAATGEGLEKLCPELSRPAAELAREMGNLRVAGPEPKRLESLCSALTKSQIHLLDLGAEAWVRQLSQEDLSSLIDAGTFFKVDRPQEHGQHYLCYYWSSAFPEALQTLAELLYAQDDVVVTLFGPGLADTEVAESQGLCILTDFRIKEVLRDRDFSLAFWRAVRNRTGLRFFSPFQTQNALAKDSPVFVGRDPETRRILEGIANTSFLILGGRMIGKTSLLQHVYGKIAGEGKHTALLIDCAGCETADVFLGRLRLACEGSQLSAAMDTDPELAIEKTLRGLQKPVLFLNEIDGLSLKAQGLLQGLRGLSENGICQFVMVGYHGAFGGLHDPQHPFYHWVQGERGEKAFFLGPLSDLPARSLIAKLEQPPLEIQWENEQTRAQGYAHLSESTYRIPILLQRACQRLLERLDHDRRMTLRREDLQAGDTSARPVWQYLQDTRPALGALSTERTKTPPEEIYWGDLVLAATVEALFYRPQPAPIRDPTLRERPPERSLSFNDASIRIYVRQALERLQLLPEDLQLIDERFGPEAYGKFLDVMTLTVLVAPSPGEDRAYHFSNHIYPLELDLYLQMRRITIEDHILEQAGNLLEALRQTTVTSNRASV